MATPAATAPADTLVTVLATDVLLVTATDIETRSTLAAFHRSAGTTPVLRSAEKNTVHDLGIYGGQRVALVQSSMGTSGPGGAMLTVHSAIRALRPTTVIMLGILFGADPKKQAIGDILVSQQIWDYELQRVGTKPTGNVAITFRGDLVSASPRLISLARAVAQTWPNNVRFGLIASGEKLVDNAGFKADLREVQPELIGGDMEGRGIYAASYREGIEWIVIKAICDWADGKKSVNKGRRQLTAATNAAEFVCAMLKSPAALEVTSRDSPHKPLSKWNEWRDEPEPTPLIGRVDQITLVSDWVSAREAAMTLICGPGGVGKTSLAMATIATLEPRFEKIFRCSVEQLPPLRQVLSAALAFLSDERLDLTGDEEGLLGQLWTVLERRRILVFIDNYDSLFKNGESAGQYRAGFESYTKLVELLARRTKGSSSIITSRVILEEVAGSNHRPTVNILRLEGLASANAQEFLARYNVNTTVANASEFAARYAGNPLAMKLAAGAVSELWHGDIATFLRNAPPVFGEMRKFVESLIQGLPQEELYVLMLLAAARHSLSIEQVVGTLEIDRDAADIFSNIWSLTRRGLLETRRAGLALQPILSEYLTGMLVARAVQDIESGEFAFLDRIPLLNAEASVAIRQSQHRLVLGPIRLRLFKFSDSALKDHIEVLLTKIRSLALSQRRGYAAANLINLMFTLPISVQNIDLSGLTLKGVDFEDVELGGAFLNGSELHGCLFNQHIDVVMTTDQAENYLAAGGADGQLHIWGLPERNPVRATVAHAGRIRGVVFSPDQSKIATCGEDGRLKIWSIATGALVGEYLSHVGRAHCLAYSPDGAFLASGGDDGRIHVYPTSDPNASTTIETTTSSAVLSLQFSADGRELFAIVLGEPGVQAWTAPAWLPNGNYDVDSASALTTLARSGDGNYVAAGSADGHVFLWHSRSRILTHVLDGHSAAVRCLRFSPSSETLSSASDDWTVRVWDAALGRVRHVLAAHTNRVYTVGYTTDSIVSAGEDHTIRFWDRDNAASTAVIRGSTRWVWSVAFDSEQSIVRCGTDRAILELRDTETLGLVSERRGHTNRIRAVSATSARGQFLTGSDDSSVLLWNSISSDPIRAFTDHTKRVRCVAVGKSGELGASGGDDGTVRLWDLASGVSLGVVGSHSGWVRSIAFGDEVLVSAGEDGIIKLWDVGSRALIKAWPAHAGKVHAVAYDDGLQILVSCGNDTQICIWDMTGKLIRALNGSTQHSRAVAVAKGMIVAGCDDQYVRIWSTDSFDLQCEYHAHSRWVFSVAIDQRNSRILSGGEDGAICEYHLPSGTRRTISIDRLYEGLRIDRIRGVSDGQLRELAALGARVR